MPAGLLCLLVGGIDYWPLAIVKCRRPGMACSAKLKHKVMTWVRMEEVCNRSSQDCNWGKKQSVTWGLEEQAGTSITRAWLHSLLECMVYSWA